LKLSRPLILLTLAAILPLTVLSAALGVSSLQQEQQAMQSEAEARVDLAAAVLERELQRQIAVLSAVAQSPMFDGPLDRPALTTYLQRLAKTQPLWRAVILSDPAGGRLVSMPETVAVPGKAVDIDSHRLAVATRRPVVGRIMRRPSGLMIFSVRAPVVRDGKVRYVVSAGVDPNSLRSLFLRDPLPDGWRAGVIDASGRVVMRINGSQEAVGGFATPDSLRTRELSSRGFAQTMSLEGEPIINAFKVLPGFDWSVHASIPLTLYRAPVVRSVWLLGIAAIVTALLAGTFLWLFAREIGLRQRQEEALEETRRMEALGRMTGGVAHDFNNLLMIVQGSAEMLKRRRSEPHRVESFADAILSATQRGQALTRQLLTFARRGAHEPVNFRLQERAETLSELIRRAVGEKVVVTVMVPPDAWAVRADPDVLEIALINLAVNARDAMPEGGLLTITAANVAFRRDRGAATALEGDYVSIAVKDTGSGVPEEHLSHIFEPFYTTKPTGRGTGLGLSQVYGFAKQSGGAVTVASRPNEGAVFTLYIPRAPYERATPIQGPRRQSAKALEPGRVLLVEDDPDLARAVEGMLVGGGYAVLSAVSAVAALALLDAEADFDAVVSDMLADRSGAELIASLRMNRPGLAVVLMTGQAGGAAESSIESVLHKPFEADQLLAALARARAAAAAPAESAQPLSA
jgi:signal transduction histidine kinase/CheY-like chemotaxis protein